MTNKVLFTSTRILIILISHTDEGWKKENRRTETHSVLLSVSFCSTHTSHSHGKDVSPLMAATDIHLFRFEIFRLGEESWWKLVIFGNYFTFAKVYLILQVKSNKNAKIYKFRECTEIDNVIYQKRVAFFSLKQFYIFLARGK